MIGRTDPLRRNRIVLSTLAVVALLGLLGVARGALGPFIFALALGYLLGPLVDRLSRRVPRILAILLVYGLFFGSLIGLGFLVIPGVADQIRDLVRSYPQYGAQVQGYTRDVQTWYASLDLPPQVRASIESALQNSGDNVASIVQTALLGTLRAVTGAVSFVVGLFVIPFWLFYVLKDKDAGVRSFYELIPHSIRIDVQRILRIASDVLNDYIRGQLLLGLVVGAATTVGLLLVGAPYWLLFGVINGFTELIPVLGPIIGAIPGLIIAAFTGDIGLFLKILAVYIVVQLAENNLLVPKIQGDSVKLHPAIIILALIMGGEVGGLLGVIMAVPVTAISRDLFVYLYNRLGRGYTPHDAEALVPSRIDEEAGQAPPPAAEC
ncbi:MAG: AI-2E family transporter [Chloroflexota bacterium]|nr:AI-2E family transporter [Chloroflexota bacterium]